MIPLLDDRSVRCAVLSIETLGKTHFLIVLETIGHSVTDKARIIALYILYRDGVVDEDRKRLYQHARLGIPEIEAVNALVHLGQEVVKVRAHSCRFRFCEL